MNNCSAFKTMDKHTYDLHTRIGVLTSIIKSKDKKIARLEENFSNACAETEARLEKKYGKKIEQLRKKNAGLEESLANSRRSYEESRKRIAEKDARISQLEKLRIQNAQEIKKLNDANLEQTKKITDLQAMIEYLKTSRKKNHKNSSVPSSQDPLNSRAKVTNSRTPSGKPPGKQCGTPGAGRPKPAETDKSENVPLNDLKEENPSDWILTGRTRERRELDIKVEKEWKTYISYEYVNIHTGEKKFTPFPPTIVNEMNYAPHYKAVMLFLHEFCNVPVKKTAAFFEALLGKGCAPSTGMICNLPKQMSGLLDEYKRQKIERMLTLDGLHVDHTPVKWNGKQMQVLVLRHKMEGTIYIVSESKGINALNETPLKDYIHTLIHDHASAFYHFGSDHQECLAHVLRYLLAASELDSRLTWPEKMIDLLDEMIHSVNISPVNRVSDEQAVAFRRRYEEILELAEKEYKQFPPNKYNREGLNLAVRLKAFEDQHLTFLTNPDVDATNNEAESAARKVKRIMKRKGTWRNKDYISYDCDVLTILEDARLRGEDPVYVMTRIFAMAGSIPASFNGFVN